ncbi:hypothetical protein [Sulfurimonas sp.]
MTKPKSIIPEFMIKNPDDVFMFLMPLNLKLDYENYANSHFSVAVKNLTKSEFFTTELSPELFFTKFRFHQAYKKGKQFRQYKRPNNDIKLQKKQFRINTELLKEKYDVALLHYMDEMEIGKVLGWKRKYLEEAKKIRCFIFEQEDYNIIIPHYAIAIYYYYRTTAMREAILNCNLENLYIAAHNDGYDASIVIPKYVTKAEAPFICRFATVENAHKKFEETGQFILNYIHYIKNKSGQYPENTPIKAKFPMEDVFLIDVKVHEFREKGKRSYFVHELVNDDSYIGFKTLQVLREHKQSSIDIDSLDKLPTVPRDIPGKTTEVLKIEGASKRKQHTTVRTKRRQCNSLAGVSISEDTVTLEGIDTLLKVYKEEASDEVTDQSLTESSKNTEKKIRKTRISSEYEKKQKEKKEYTHNFDEFHQYINYLKQQPAIKNLTVSPNQNMEQVIDIYTDKEHHKCNIEGRPRQYNTATFQYKKIYVGLLELENKPGTATSTWVISSVKSVNQSVFDKFLYHFVDEDKKINDMKEEYKNNMQMQFSTKNHERAESLNEEDLAKWMVGVLGKLIKA